MSTKRKIAIALSAIMIFSETSQIFAGPPTVTSDESVYINLDYYGKQESLSVVKGCMLNGNTEIVDYGQYEKVTNMTDYTEPVLDEDKVTWKVSDPTKRFFFEAVPKEGTVIPPWTFDISYRLNGVPIAAEELAGKSGLVKITIEAIPNENAPEYFKNNMVLQIATAVDMDKTNSLEAKGAQTQTVGTYKGIVFMALPGEHVTFDIEIGTDSFETPGITMMMIPITLQQIEDIKELKENKDKIEDSVEAVNQSLDDMINVLQNMSSGLENTKSGLSDYDEVRNNINTQKGEIYDNADNALEALTNLSKGIDKSFKDAKTQLTDISKSLKSIKEDIDAFQKLAKDIHDKSDERKKIMEDLQSSLDKLSEDSLKLRDTMTDVNDKLFQLETSAEDLRGIISLTQTINEQVGQAVGILASSNPDLGMIVPQLTTIASETNSASSEIYDVINDSIELGKQARTTNDVIKSVLKNTSIITDSLNSFIDLTNEYLELVDDDYENIDNSLGELSKITDTASELLITLSNIAGETETSIETVTENSNSIEGLANTNVTSINNISNSINKLVDFLSSLENLLKTNGDKFNSGTEKTIQGLIDVINNSLEGITKTENLRNAKDEIKEAVDEELDRFEKETNVLNMDPDANRISFTSEKNPEPDSIQIILRSEEISLDDPDEVLDYEKAPENVGFFRRVLNVFKKLFGKIFGV